LLAADWSLGPLTITGSDVVQIHFLNRNPSSSPNGIAVAIRFLDSTGKIVATADGDCEFDVCPPGPLLVDAQHIRTVSLTGASLNLAGDQTMLIQPIVDVVGPAKPFLRITLEQFSGKSSDHSIVPFIANGVSQTLVQRWDLGPVTLQAGELARFSVTYCGPGKAALRMFFEDANGAVLEATPVMLGLWEAASIELDGDATNITGVPGVISAGVSGFGLISAGTLDNLGGTLEIIDKASGASKARLSLWGCGGTRSGGGTGNGGGGIGNQ